MERRLLVFSCMCIAVCTLESPVIRAEDWIVAQSPVRQQPYRLPALEVLHPEAEFHRQHHGIEGDSYGTHGDHDEGDAEQCHDYDWIEDYQDNHETMDGFPRVHLLKTEHAWLDPHWQIRYAGVQGSDDGTVDEHEFEFEYFHVFNSRLAIHIEVPYIFLNPDAGQNVNGFGDLHVGAQWLAYNGDYSQLSFGLIVHTPTGDEERDLGEGHAALEPVLLWYYDLGCGNALQSQFSIDAPISVADMENEFAYNIGYSHTFGGTRDNRYFRWLTPLVELNGSTLLNGADSGRNVINITPGVRWFVGEENQMGVGMSFPITGDKNSNSEVIVSYIAHF